jgi:hypothetical protein
MQPILIATRHYDDFDPCTGERYDLQDRMLRRACGSFVLMTAGEKPGDPEVEEAYSLAGVFEWLRELPEQIKRSFVRGPASSQLNVLIQNITV